MAINIGIRIILNKLTPQARIAMISLSEDNLPKTSKEQTSNEIGMEYDNVKGKPPQIKLKTIAIEAPRAIRLTALKISPTDITKLNTTRDIKKVSRN